MNEINKILGIGTSTILKYIKNNTVYHGYKWEFVGT